MSDERAGQYRYVRGRTIDPDTGRPAGAEEIPVSEVVEPGAEVLAPPPPRVSRRLRARRGRALGPVRDLEDTPWGQTSSPRRRLPSQRVLWTGSGALAAVIAMVVLGASHSDSPAAAPDAAPAPAAVPAIPARGVVVVQPVEGRREAVQAVPAVQVADAADGGASPARAAQPAASAPAEVAPPAAPAPVSIETVRIAINATPWALIEIDGQEVGETPLAGVELAVGRHRFVAHMPDGTQRERVTHVDEAATAVLFE